MAMLNFNVQEMFLKIQEKIRDNTMFKKSSLICSRTFQEHCIKEHHTFLN